MPGALSYEFMKLGNTFYKWAVVCKVSNLLPAICGAVVVLFYAPLIGKMRAPSLVLTHLAYYLHVVT